MIKYYVTNAYYFIPLSTDEIEKAVEHFKRLGDEYDLRGSLLLASEGFNIGFCTRVASDLGAIKNEVQRFFSLPELLFKDHRSDVLPYRRWRIQKRASIVNLGDMQLPATLDATHLSPNEWRDWMQKEDVVVLDTRNDYEYEVGHFQGAVHLNLDEFQSFPARLQNSSLPKNKTYLIYCTGGIRCEKAVVEMHNQGYANVKQLDGGIFKFLEKFPNKEFTGECFVFDHRVAVDQDGNRSKKHGLCPHTGLIGSTEVICARCGHKAIVHASCLSDPTNHTCSKNCAHHYRLNPNKKGHRQIRTFDQTKEHKKVSELA